MAMTNTQSSQKYRRKYPERDRDQKLRRRYGIGLAEYNQMLEDQDFKCLVCKIDIESKTAHVDHNHATKRVRGLLCHHCNTGLGLFKDQPSVLVDAATYLVGGGF